MSIRIKWESSISFSFWHWMAVQLTSKKDNQQVFLNRDTLLGQKCSNLTVFIYINTFFILPFYCSWRFTTTSEVSNRASEINESTLWRSYHWIARTESKWLDIPSLWKALSKSAHGRLLWQWNLWSNNRSSQRHSIG